MHASPVAHLSVGVNAIAPLDLRLHDALRHAIDRKTKPLGSLGRIEGLALRIGLIQRSLRPAIVRPTLLVFAADHGIVAEGVSAFPQVVTSQMVANFLAGGAAVNVFCRSADVALEVIDAGVATPLPRDPALVSMPVGPGTRDFLHAPAMSREQLDLALRSGAARVAHHAELGCNTIGFGEMGIGNTSSAACLMSRLCDLPIDICVGRGTGVDDAGLARKRSVLARALAAHPRTDDDPLATLATFGGFEIAMIAGGMLAAAARSMVILVDGFIASAALLAAAALERRVLDYCVFAHTSRETGHRLLLERLEATPLLDLDLRLGEGTGCALAVPLLRAATAMLCEMASFESANVSDRG
ncbi:nicotinate-nucleotide--dimethylbenzimidazole phosphoribosyltransferase [Chitinasiproducens palmae]